MAFRAVGDLTKKVYMTGETKAEVMRRLIEKYDFKVGTTRQPGDIYVEPLWIERVG